MYLFSTKLYLLPGDGKIYTGPSHAMVNMMKNILEPCCMQEICCAGFWLVFMSNN